MHLKRKRGRGIMENTNVTTKKKYQLGDKVRIKVLKCDKIKKTIDFSLIDGNIEGVENSGKAERDETDRQ